MAEAVKTVYRMSGCEVVRHELLCGLVFFTLAHNNQIVAEFVSQRAAINYLAKEFVVAIQH